MCLFLVMVIVVLAAVLEDIASVMKGSHPHGLQQSCLKYM